jgi:hypothetical protein
VELTSRAIGRVNAGLGGRQRKDEPAAADVDGAKVENITEKGSVGLRVVAIQEDMRACDSRNQGGSLASGRIPGKECF